MFDSQGSMYSLYMQALDVQILPHNSDLLLGTCVVWHNLHPSNRKGMKGSFDVFVRSEVSA